MRTDVRLCVRLHRGQQGPQGPARRQGRQPRRDDPDGPAGATGFTITTEACRAYLRSGSMPKGLFAEIEHHLRLVQTRIGKTLGDADDPLLLSVRSGGKFSMPGMMETYAA
ncbi:hypothetical protein Ari01nite_95250 [Paractinoplanes rishiriensis]|uniref:Pyruvate, phosphate dikinase n=1 Tax=Paractinoplanes rishiriensis TaxID=1050105 RepID=A0A919K6W8_9ACTN|nr:hypothetical protein Ari01nite_95250 [Actinoplanes rishiriensis]